MKYAQRYGKKGGFNRQDLLKVLHYGIIAIHNHDLTEEMIMKLSDKTLGVLKNYANINQGLMFKKGKVLKTVSSHKNILSEATISEDIPADFGVYDLNNFLSVVSLDKDNPSFSV